MMQEQFFPVFQLLTGRLWRSKGGPGDSGRHLLGGGIFG